MVVKLCTNVVEPWLGVDPARRHSFHNLCHSLRQGNDMRSRVERRGEAWRRALLPNFASSKRALRSSIVFAMRFRTVPLRSSTQQFSTIMRRTRSSVRPRRGPLLLVLPLAIYVMRTFRSSRALARVQGWLWMANYMSSSSSLLFPQCRWRLFGSAFQSHSHNKDPSKHVEEGQDGVGFNLGTNKDAEGRRWTTHRVAREKGRESDFDPTIPCLRTMNGTHASR